MTNHVFKSPSSNCLPLNSTVTDMPRPTSIDFLGGDGYNVPDIICDIYFGGLHPCFGGVLALDGATGAEIWRVYTVHEVFALNCNADFNGDGQKDCLAGGRAAVR
jgi:PQQ enzyme repeat